MEFGRSELGKEYIKFCRLRFDAVHANELDLSKIDWFYPISLLPLGILMKERPDIHVIHPSDSDVSNYVNIITKSEMISYQRTYIPIVQIPIDKIEGIKHLNHYIPRVDTSGALMRLVISSMK